MSREEYHTPFTDARLKYNELMLAEHRFRQELTKLSLVCPACKKAAVFNYDDQRKYYWIACTECGLRTSYSTNFAVVTYQWDALSERPLSECYAPYVGKPHIADSGEDGPEVEL